MPHRAEGASAEDPVGAVVALADLDLVRVHIPAVQPRVQSLKLYLAAVRLLCNKTS